MRILCLLALVAAVAVAEVRLGQELALTEVIPIETITAKPAAFNGKMVQVKGRVTEVCEMMGCWMKLVSNSGKESVRIKVNDGDVVFPKTAVGKMAVAEGKLTTMELTREQVIAQAKHEAEEQGRTFHPETIKSGATVVQIQGSGAVILD